MKKKVIPEAVVSPQILDMAKKSADPEKTAPLKRCAVCSAECIPLTGPQVEEEDLCWVCRRLKISAWRESEPQMSAQE